ncbi:hypothetical protein GH714_014892 [Hevea brasiliensis]|uniref:Uncharacterized protein n=1 Tax=Hevea brasiliensis TaxID=3981 RepID=A0A6A6KQ47_HEVBR|nr:hypothetical protein GH714_014892 [Hevea brasiliensis]
MSACFRVSSCHALAFKCCSKWTWSWCRPSNIHQTIRVPGEAQHSEKNICLRRAPKDEQLGLLFKPTRSCIDQNPFANDPSNSSFLMISSGIAEYIVEENDGGEETAPVMHWSLSVAASGLGASSGPSNIHQTIVEENDGGEGCSLDGRHLYCKLRALKDEQLGTRLMLALETAPIIHQPSSVATSGLGAGARTSDIHQTIGVAREA